MGIYIKIVLYHHNARKIIIQHFVFKQYKDLIKKHLYPGCDIRLWLWFVILGTCG